MRDLRSLLRASRSACSTLSTAYHVVHSSKLLVSYSSVCSLGVWTAHHASATTHLTHSETMQVNGARISVRVVLPENIISCSEEPTAEAVEHSNYKIG
jgi:hypothetical protein